MKVKIVKNVNLPFFPYGYLDKEEMQFIKNSIGQIFNATRHNINYYRLENGNKVHIYDAVECDEENHICHEEELV